MGGRGGDLARGEQAEVPNLHEAPGQDVEHEAPEEFEGRQTDRQVNVDVSLEFDGAAAAPSECPAQPRRSRPAGAGTLRFRLSRHG